MPITSSRRVPICQSVAEVYLTDMESLEAVSHRFNFKFLVDYIDVLLMFVEVLVFQ